MLGCPQPSRRQFLGASASLAGLGALPRGAGEGDDDALDAAYARVQAQLPHANLHRSNHVPMVVEALATLGRADAIEPWLAENLADAAPDAGLSRPIDPADLRAALGDAARFSDWRAFFLRELADGDWRLVLRTRVPVLAPGLAGAATHGVIRTAHASRALAQRDSELRRQELATGLAYWAASWQELPWNGALAPESDAESVEAALAKLEPRQPALAPPRGNIVTGLGALADTPSFLPVAGLVDVRDPLRTLGEMAPAFARLYLANPGQRIPFTHSVTAPSALRLLVPYLDEETVQRATRFAWQAAAGLYVVYGDPRSTAPAPAGARSREELVAAAIANGGAHSIKLTEACLREHAIGAEAVLLQAAADAGAALNG